MRKIYRGFYILLFLCSGLLSAYGQQGVVSSGGKATGEGGSVARSTGLTDFRFYHSQEGSVQHGIQQGFKLFPLFITLNDPELGAIQPEEGQYKMEPGQQITLTAMPAEEMVFINWTDSNGQVVSDESTFVYTLSSGDVTLQANFRDPTAVPINSYSVVLALLLALGFLVLRSYKTA